MAYSDGALRKHAIGQNRGFALRGSTMMALEQAITWAQVAFVESVKQSIDTLGTPLRDLSRYSLPHRRDLQERT